MTQAYDKFLEYIQNPLKAISKGNGYLTNPQYLPGTIRHEASKLKKGTGGRALPAVIASYYEDSITDQKQQPKTHRLGKDSFNLSNSRQVIITGVVASFEEGDEPGDYIEDIENLLHDVKKALSSKELKFISVGFILDNDEETYGLAGFSLKITYNFIENFTYD